MSYYSTSEIPYGTSPPHSFQTAPRPASEELFLLVPASQICFLSDPAPFEPHLYHYSPMEATPLSTTERGPKIKSNRETSKPRLRSKSDSKLRSLKKIVKDRLGIGEKPFKSFEGLAHSWPETSSSGSNPTAKTTTDPSHGSSGAYSWPFRTAPLPSYQEVMSQHFSTPPDISPIAPPPSYEQALQQSRYEDIRDLC